MARQMHLRFHDDAPCFHQGGATRTEVGFLSSFGHSKPNMDNFQQPQMDFFIMQNYTMKKPIKQIMSERLDYLMRVNPSLETLQKLADKSGVGYGTVRRVKSADAVDVSLENIAQIADAFNLSVAEFLSEPGTAGGLDSEESVLIQKFRTLSQKDKTEVMFFASSKAAINKVMSESSGKQDQLQS